MKNKERISRQNRRRGHRHQGTLIAAGIGVVAVAVAFIFFIGGRPTTSEPTIPPGVSLASWSENGHGGRYILQMLEGNAPPAGVTVSGVVLSDSDCEPDSQGLNHCHNVIKLANGTRITVINNHRMKLNRCLRAGDSVSLTRINASWVLAKLS